MRKLATVGRYPISSRASLRERMAFMRLAAVYVQKDADGPKELALDKVQLIEVSDDTLTCTNLFAKTVTITGAIKRVDLANSTVFIAAK